MERSPAVERVLDSVQRIAQSEAAEELRLTDWLLGLLADEDGKPAVLLDRFGVERETIHAAVAENRQWGQYKSPLVEQLLAAGREKAIAIRGESTLTTEFLLLAVIEAHPEFRQALEELGLSLIALENHLRPDYMVAPEAITTVTNSFIVQDPPEQIEALRVIDANLNRARESLRILDDYARFVLNDRTLTEALKTLRHDLVEATKRLGANRLLGARDTPEDVGVDLFTKAEYRRDSAANVALVNCKRLQECLRSVEEFGKILGDDLSRQIEQIRYRTYSLEGAIIRGTTARERLRTANLYALLTGSQCACTLDWTIAEAAEGGVQIIQLREKQLSDRELLERARRVRRWTREAGVLFIVNDRPDIARLVEADGVHLGQDDLPVASARKIVGTEALIGVSTHNLDQLRQAVLDGADYLGIGPTFPSKTKRFDAFAGLEFIREATQATSLPCFALGGINLDNLAEVRGAGATRIAVSSVLCESDEPRLIATQLRLGLLTLAT